MRKITERVKLICPIRRASPSSSDNFSRSESYAIPVMLLKFKANSMDTRQVEEVRKVGPFSPQVVTYKWHLPSLAGLPKAFPFSVSR